VALDKHKNFSKAAEACFITQATLSTMVKKLEEELDLIIFDRKTNPIITTDCGKIIIEEAKKMLNHTNNIKHLASEIKGKIEGELRIGVIPTIASNLLHRVVPTLLAKYPRLTLNIQESITENIVSQLKKGELDAGIISTPINMGGLEEDILYYEKLMVYGEIKNTNKQYFSPKDLINENMWLLEQGNCLTEQVMNLCSINSKKINSNLNFQPNSFESLLNMVDCLKGLTLIPELYYLDLQAEKKNNVNDFVAPYPVREVSLVFYRPYAKFRLIERLSLEIKTIIVPLLKTSKYKNSEMLIAKI
jgi:LysR family hydrogen peroxide-inducible transcriptional activator